MVSVNSVKAQAFSEWKHGIGFFANNYINPGLEYNIQTNWISTEGLGYKLLPFGKSNINLSGHIAGYWDPFSHVGFYNFYEISFEQYFGRRFGTIVGLGPGVLSTFTSENYVFNDDFEMKKRSVQGRLYFSPEFSFSFFYENKKQTYKIISKASTFIVTPYNSWFIPAFNYHLIYQF